MRRTPLKRKSPFLRSNGFKRPGPGEKPWKGFKSKGSKLKARSEKGLARDRVYRKRKGEYLRGHPSCEVPGCRNRATDLHHWRGRVGSLLMDSRFFMAACRTCHDLIHQNPRIARLCGLIAPAAIWNVPVPADTFVAIMPVKSVPVWPMVEELDDSV